MRINWSWVSGHVDPGREEAYLVQEHASAHVGEGYEDHDDERADQIALGPGLDDEALIGLGDGMVIGDIGICISRYPEDWTHGVCCRVPL